MMKEATVRYAEDLATLVVNHSLTEDELLVLAPPCHPSRGFTLAFDDQADVVVMICKGCRETCGALRIARKNRPC